jgi:hypothetical protein
MRTLIVGAAAVAGLALTGGAAAAAPIGQDAGGASFRAMDYWQFHSHYDTLEECVAVGEYYLYPNHPNGSDDYECQAKNDGWDLYLIFAT